MRMRFLIAYASKTGSTEKAARLLAELFIQKGAEAELCDLCVSTPDIASCDAVAVGGSVRMGLLHARARKFIKENAERLMEKPVGFFCCRCGTDDTRALLAPQVGVRLAERAVRIASFGGELDPARQKGLDKLIVGIVAKNGQGAGMRVEGVVRERVEAFADALLAAVQA